jgi:bifunctional non-homologous end joining protein LigD
LSSFDRIRYRRHDGDVFLYAFDLLEFNGDDLRRDPLEVRKATLRSMLAKAGLACGSMSTWKATARPSSPMLARSGLRGIVSKRKDHPVISLGRSQEYAQ